MRNADIAKPFYVFLALVLIFQPLFLLNGKYVGAEMDDNEFISLSYPFGLDFYDNEIYVAQQTDLGSYGKISKINKDTKEVTTIISFDYPAEPMAVTLNSSGDIYFALYGGVTDTNKIYKVNKETLPLTEVTQETFDSVTELVYTVEEDIKIYGLEFDSENNLYFSTDTNKVYKLIEGESTAQVVLTYENDIQDIEFDSNEDLYLVNPMSNIYKIPSGNLTNLPVSTEDVAFVESIPAVGLTFADGELYYSQPSGKIYKYESEETYYEIPSIGEDSNDENYTGYSVNSIPNGSRGIKFTSPDNRNGEWQFFDGTRWVLIEESIELDGDQLFRFYPNEDWNGETTIKYVEKQQDGLFSESENGLTMSITPVNDGPYLTEVGGSSYLNLGLNQYVAYPDLGIYSNSFTYESWVNINENQPWARFFDTSFGMDQFNLHFAFYGNTKRLALEAIPQVSRSYNPIIITDRELTLNEWVHVAAVYDDEQQKAFIYLNGDLEAYGDMDLSNMANSPVDPRPHNYLGESTWAPFDGSYIGSIRDVRFWNTAKTKEEIVSEMNGLITTNNENLVLNYEFNNPTDGAVAKDSSGNGKNGTIINGSFVSRGFTKNLATNQDTPIDKLFEVIDVDNDELTITANSSNTTLIPNGNLLISGEGSTKTLTLIPSNGQSGVSKITVDINDGEISYQSSFVLTVKESKITLSSTTFDKKSNNQQDITVTMSLSGDTLTHIKNGESVLVEGLDYTINGSSVVIKKEYLATLPIGPSPFTFYFSNGESQNSLINIQDTTPENSIISISNVTFDKKSSEQTDIAIPVDLKGNTLTELKNGETPLILGTDYTVEGSTVVIKEEYLATLPIGTTNLQFVFDEGEPQSLIINIQDTTPENSIISIPNVTFDKKSSEQTDIAIPVDLKGNTLTELKNGEIPLILGTDYTVEGSTVVIKEEYLATLPIGTTNLQFVFDEGEPQSLIINIQDTTPENSIISIPNVTFDKKSSEQTDIAIPVDLKGNTLTELKNGETPLTLGTDYTVEGSTVVIKKEYLATLPIGNTSITFIFDEGQSQNLTLTIKNTKRESGGGNSTSNSTTEEININVETGNSEKGSIVSQTTISRTKQSDGTVQDQITLSADQTKEVIQKLKEVDQNIARILITDEKDEVAQVDVSVPLESVNELGDQNISLEFYTENVTIQIPESSLDDFNKDMYFRVVPIKDELERQKVEDRARIETIVKDYAGDLEVNVVSRPMTIETNLQSRPVTLVLPLRDVDLPTDTKQREAFLSDLVIFVEHSDGEKELIKPRVVEYNDGELGLEFGVTKFSSFTILNMEGWEEVLSNPNPEQNENQEQGHEQQLHKPYISGYGELFKPNASITRAQMASMLAQNLEVNPSTAQFSDVVKNHWAHENIMEAKGAGVMKGVNSSTFNPNGTVTRAQMAVIAYSWIKSECAQDETKFDSCANLENTTSSTFVDVSANHWAIDAISFAKESKLMLGYDDNTFRPNEKLTRAQAVIVLNKLFKRGPLTNVNVPTFKDVPKTHWAFGHIEEAAKIHQVYIDSNKNEILQ
nr:X2-like carbohydrate binding domain-containing protein [Lysinibacillus timonensis]